MAGLTSIARMVAARLLGGSGVSDETRGVELPGPTILVSRPHAPQFDQWMMRDGLGQGLERFGGPVLGVRSAGDSPLDRDFWVLQFQVLMELSDIVLVIAPEQNANVAFEHFLADIAVRQGRTRQGGGRLCRAFLDGFAELELSRCVRRHAFTPGVLVVIQAGSRYAPPDDDEVTLATVQQWCAPQSLGIILEKVQEVTRKRNDAIRFCMELERQDPSRFRNTSLDALRLRRRWAEELRARGPFLLQDVDSPLSAAFDDKVRQLSPLLVNEPLGAVHRFFSGTGTADDMQQAFESAWRRQGDATWGALARSMDDELRRKVLEYVHGVAARVGGKELARRALVWRASAGT